MYQEIIVLSPTCLADTTKNVAFLSRISYKKPKANSCS